MAKIKNGKTRKIKTRKPLTKNKRGSRSIKKIKTRRIESTNSSSKRKSKLSGKIKNEKTKKSKTINSRRLSKTKKSTNRKTENYSSEIRTKVSSRTEKIYRYTTSNYATRKFHEIRLRKKDQLDLTDEENQDAQFVYDKLVKYLPNLYKKAKKTSDLGVVIIYYNGVYYDAVSSGQRDNESLESVKDELFDLVVRLIQEIKRYKKFNPIIMLSKLGLREYLN